MKKVLFLILASFLVLAACGNKEENKTEDKKETKSSSKDEMKKNEDKKAKDDKKEKSKPNNNTENETQQANTEQQTQQVQIQNTQQTNNKITSNDENVQQDANNKGNVKLNDEPFKPKEHGGGHPQLYTNEDLPDDIGEAKNGLTPYNKDHTTTHDESMMETPQAQQSNESEVETSVQFKDSRDPHSDERIQHDRLTVNGINE